MLEDDMSNFVALLRCNAVEAELSEKHTKTYRVVIEEI